MGGEWCHFSDDWGVALLCRFVIEKAELYLVDRRVWVELRMLLVEEECICNLVDLWCNNRPSEQGQGGRK